MSRLLTKYLPFSGKLLSGRVASPGEELAVLKFFDRLWSRHRSTTEREHKRDQERLAQRRRIEDKQRKEEEQDRDDAAFVVLISDEMYRFEQQLRADLADAITASRMAYAQAEEPERAAIEFLRQVQAEALVLSDGRRVYFTADGAGLYGEDHREVTDEATLAEAARLLQERRSASTYEDFDRADHQLKKAVDHKQRIGEALERLDDLQERLDSGELSREDLVRTREEFDQIIASLPQPARDIYDELRAARDAEDLSRRPAGDAFAAAPVLQSDFERAASRLARQTGPDSDLSEPDPDRKPVYKPLPME